MIKRIEIRFFRGIEKLDINVKRFNMFVGINGSGKTSVISAIRFALTGKAHKGDIKNGHTNAGVRVIFDDGSYFTRYLTTTGISGDCNGKKTTTKSINEYIEMKLGMTMYAISMMLGEESYTDANMSSLLMSLISIRVEKASFIKIAEKIKGSELTRAEVYVINRYFGDIITTEDLNKAETVIKSEKAVYNKDIKKIEALLKTYSAKPERSKEELETLLAGTSYHEIYKVKMQEYESSVKAHKTILERKQAKEAELERYKNISVVNAEEKVQKEKRISELEREIAELEKTITATTANNSLIIKTLDALNTSVCPISNKLICSTDKTPLKQELENQEKANEAIVEECTAKIENYRLTITQIRDELTKTYELEENWKKRETLEREIRELEETMPTVKEKPVAPKEPELSKEEIIKQLHVWDSIKEKELKEAELDNLKKRVVLLTYVQNLLKPENAKTEIVKRVIEPVEKIVNEKAKKIGKKIRIVAEEKGICVYLETKTGYINITNCSSGEFVDVVYLIMSTISSINNANIIVLDNLDKLDNEALRKLVVALENDSQFKYIFIAGIHAVPGTDATNISK